MMGNTLDKPGAILKREKVKKTSERDEELRDCMKANEDANYAKEMCERS